MARLGYLAVVFVAILTHSCQANLIVEKVETAWDSSSRLVMARVSNNGIKDINANDPVQVYFEAVESPANPTNRNQIIVTTVGGVFDADAYHDVVVDFSPLANASNSFLANVDGILVTVNPKRLTKEWDYADNTRYQDVQAPNRPGVLAENVQGTAGYVPFTFGVSLEQVFQVSEAGQLLGIEALIYSNYYFREGWTYPVALSFGQDGIYEASVEIEGYHFPRAGVPAWDGAEPNVLHPELARVSYFDLRDSQIMVEPGKPYWFRLSFEAEPWLWADVFGAATAAQP